MPYYESMFGGGNYSETEQKTGQYWIDGKEIFRKVIDFGALPSSGSKRVAHLISNLGEFTFVYAIARVANNNVTVSVPYVAQNALTSVIALDITATEVVINVGQDRSNLSAKIILEYTKS